VSLVGRQLNAADAGGLRIQYTGLPGEINVVGGMESQQGYSATMPVWMPPMASMPASAVTLGHPGLMVGTPDPVMGFPASTRFSPYLNRLDPTSVSTGRCGLGCKRSRVQIPAARPNVSNVYSLQRSCECQVGVQPESNSLDSHVLLIGLSVQSTVFAHPPVWLFGQLAAMGNFSKNSESGFLPNRRRSAQSGHTNPTVTSFSRPRHRFPESYSAGGSALGVLAPLD
jgi:hypothetical protein